MKSTAMSIALAACWGQLNNHPGPVVLEDRDRLPRPVHLCRHSRKVILRLGEPHSKSRHITSFDSGQNMASDQSIGHNERGRSDTRYARLIKKHRLRPTNQGRGRGLLL